MCAVVGRRVCGFFAFLTVPRYIVVSVPSHASSSRSGEPCRGNGQSDGGFMGAASPAGAFGCDRSPARQGGYHGVTQHLTGKIGLVGCREYTLRSRSWMVIQEKLSHIDDSCL